MAGRPSPSLAELRARIERLEARPVLAGEAELGTDPLDLLRAPAGLLHEIFGGDLRDGAAALGFALGQARSLLTRARPAILIVQLAKEAQDMGMPYGAGLTSLGIDPDAVVIGRVETMTEFLWAIEEAVNCAAVAAVIGDLGRPHKELDFTASRRLSLRAAAAGTSMFLLRYGEGREASAARLRWGLAPVLSGETMFDARAPNGPRFRARLEKGRLKGRRSAGLELLLDWTKDGFVLAGDSTAAGSTPRRGAGAAVPRALPAALGDRLPEAG
jgi:protein ImuA